MSLNEVWEAASATPYYPLIDKDSQFFVGFCLLLIGENKKPIFDAKENTTDSHGHDSFHLHWFLRSQLVPIFLMSNVRIGQWACFLHTMSLQTDRSFSSFLVSGIPAAFAFG